MVRFGEKTLSFLLLTDRFNPNRLLMQLLVQVLCIIARNIVKFAYFFLMKPSYFTELYSSISVKQVLFCQLLGSLTVMAHLIVIMVQEQILCNKIL